MRRLLTAATAALLLSVVAPSGPATAQDPTAPVAANAELLANIPDVGAIGAKVRTLTDALGNTRRFLLVSTVHGVSAYDVTIPEVPILASHLVLPNLENEDVEMGEDVLLVSSDDGFVTSRLGGLYVIDISQLPLMTFAYVNPATGNRFRAVKHSGPIDPVYTENGRTLEGNGSYAGGHTVSCVDDSRHAGDCDYALSTGGGGGSGKLYLIDLREPSSPRLARVWNSPVGATHDVQTDEAGISWLVGGGGLYAMDFRADPENPRWISGFDTPDVGYHHNSERPNAQHYRPTSGGDATPDLSEGEVALITEEEIYDTCANQGQFATASVVNFDQAEPGWALLDRWTTELKTPSNVGDPSTGNQVAAAVCSAHYFEEQDGVVAIGWYQQGVRFLDVSNPKDIRQIGYFITPTSAAWAAVWNPGTDVVYAIDASRGIDVLRFGGEAGTTGAVRADVPLDWLAPRADLGLVPHPEWGLACAINVT